MQSTLRHLSTETNQATKPPRRADLWNLVWVRVEQKARGEFDERKVDLKKTATHSNLRLLGSAFLTPSTVGFSLSNANPSALSHPNPEQALPEP